MARSKAIIVVQHRGAPSLNVFWRRLNIVHAVVYGIRPYHERGLPEYAVFVTGCCMRAGTPGTFHTYVLDYTREPHRASVAASMVTLANAMTNMVHVGAFKTESDVVKWLTDGALDK